MDTVSDTVDWSRSPYPLLPKQLRMEARVGIGQNHRYVEGKFASIGEITQEKPTQYTTTTPPVHPLLALLLALFRLFSTVFRRTNAKTQRQASWQACSERAQVFCTSEILELSENRDWLDKATRAVAKHWQERNRKALKAVERIAA